MDTGDVALLIIAVFVLCLAVQKFLDVRAR